MSIGAYFQCYKEPYATFHALKSFRKEYPVSTIVLVSDNGYNYSKMAEYFNCIYIHSDTNFRMITTFNTTYKSNIRGLMDRIINACSLIKEDYVMWLEDDVCVHRSTLLPLQYDLNGYCPNTIKQIYRIAMQKDFPSLSLNTQELYYTGHGGSIYKKESLVHSLQNTSVITTLLDNWTTYFGLEGNICQDYFISILLHIQGYKVGPLEGHGDSYLVNSSLDIQHQYKVYYGLELPEDLQYLCNK